MTTPELKTKRKQLVPNETYKLGSAFLRSAKYSYKLKTLTVELRNGSTYKYYNVSRNIAYNFINAKSCSSYFQVIRQKEFKQIA